MILLVNGGNGPVVHYKDDAAIVIANNLLAMNKKVRKHLGIVECPALYDMMVDEPLPYLSDHSFSLEQVGKDDFIELV